MFWGGEESAKGRKINPLHIPPRSLSPATPSPPHSHTPSYTARSLPKHTPPALRKQSRARPAPGAHRESANPPGTRTQPWQLTLRRPGRMRQPGPRGSRVRGAAGSRWSAEPRLGTPAPPGQPEQRPRRTRPAAPSSRHRMCALRLGETKICQVVPEDKSQAGNRQNPERGRRRSPSKQRWHPPSSSPIDLTTIPSTSARWVCLHVPRRLNACQGAGEAAATICSAPSYHFGHFWLIAFLRGGPVPPAS